MKRALVLSGGGSRGAYEIGAWQAMEELGIRFQAVYGTSIGAINAGLVAQGDLELACSLWDNISLREIIATDEESFSVDHMIARKRDVLPFLIENARRLQMDISPLIELLDSHLSEARVRASGMELGVMTVRVPQMQPVPMRLSDMPEGALHRWLIASASCFPVFPLCRIDDEKYLDGGYFDNLPIDMAILDGADESVAVDIHPQPTHPEYTCMPFLRTIHPLHNLGGFLDFTPRLLRRSRQMGYCDAMKSYGHFDGIRYTFTHLGELKIAPQARRFMRMAAAFDAEAIRRTAFHGSQPGDAPLIFAIEAETPLHPLSWKDVWLRGLELCAQTMGFREDAIYDPERLLDRIRSFARVGETIERIDERTIYEAARLGSRELLSHLYRALLKLNAFPAECVRALSGYPCETAAALFLYCASNG